MADSMKTWIGAVLIGSALVGIWLLPPKSFGRPDDPVQQSVQLRHEELANDFRWTAEALRRSLWADSLSALTVATAEQGVAVGMPPSELVGAELAAEHSSVVRAGVSELPRRTDGMLFGYFHQPYSHGRTADMSAASRGRTETYVGTRDGVEYCLQVRVRRRGAVQAVLGEIEGISGVPPKTDRMGPCRFYLQYGMGGPRIQEWLESGAVGFGLETGEKPEPSEEWARSLRKVRAFGFNALGSGDRPIEVDQCRAGLAEACGALVLRPSLANPIAVRELEIVRRSPALSVGWSTLEMGVTADDASYLLSDLEAEFGPDAFRRFWTSGEDVGPAFEDAFGMTVNEWAVGWMRSVNGVLPATPTLARTTTSGSMIFVGLLVGLAYLRNRKRKLA